MITILETECRRITGFFLGHHETPNSEVNDYLTTKDPDPAYFSLIFLVKIAWILVTKGLLLKLSSQFWSLYRKTQTMELKLPKNMRWGA